MDDDFEFFFELSLLPSNIRKEVVVCWILSFNFKENMSKKAHNMFSSMLDPNFKVFIWYLHSLVMS